MRFSFIRSSVLLIIIGLTASLLNGCAFTREKLDLETSAFLKFRVSNTVNPDSNGRSSPIVLNLFYLTDNRQFEQEDIISLLQNAEDRLGKDMMDKVRLKEFIPGEVRVETFKLNKRVKYIGVLAEYVQYDKAEAKLLLPIEPHTKNKYFVDIDKLAVTGQD